MFHRLTADNLLASGFISVQFDPDYDDSDPKTMAEMHEERIAAHKEVFGTMAPVRHSVRTAPTASYTF